MAPSHVEATIAPHPYTSGNLAACKVRRVAFGGTVSLAPQVAVFEAVRLGPEIPENRPMSHWGNIHKCLPGKGLTILLNPRSASA
jgi:hypothetical protein